MDQKALCEELPRNALDFKCEKAFEAVNIPIACPTPQKNTEPSPITSKEGRTQLPQKYWILADLFGHLSCSLRLLRLRKKTPTFQNIRSQVEVLSKREFSYRHLAQMMYIFPEGICIDKVLVHDKKSLCMIPDMHISLIFRAVDEHSGVSADLALRRDFNSRLIVFFSEHPKVTDIPEAKLPEPFSHKTGSLICEDSHVEEYKGESSNVSSSTALLSTSNQINLSPKKFQLYPSFRRHFSGKNVAGQTEKVQCFSSTKTSLSSHVSNCLDNVWQRECSPLPDHVTNLNMERGQQKESFSVSSQPSVTNTPVHMICPPQSVSYKSESPDMKNISCIADSLMIETPAQSAPQRLLPMSDVKLQNMPTQKSASGHKPAKRVLDFSLNEGNDDLDTGVNKLEPSRALQEFDTFPESSRGCSEDCNISDYVSVPQEH